MASMTTYVNENKDDIHNIWGIKLSKGDLSEKCVIGCCHQVFGLWCGSELKRGKQSRKRVDGERVDTSGFDLKPAKYLEPFIQDQKNYRAELEELLLREDSDDEGL